MSREEYCEYLINKEERRRKSEIYTPATYKDFQIYLNGTDVPNITTAEPRRFVREDLESDFSVRITINLTDDL